MSRVTGVLDAEWKPPHEFRHASINNILSYWMQTCLESSGSRPKYSVFAMRGQAELLMADLGYRRTVRVLAWMASPMSKFYQWPYSLRAVQRGNDELSKAEVDGKVFEHRGFVGPVGLRNLLDLRRG